MKRRKRYFVIVGIALLVIVAFFTFTKPSSPDGRYGATSEIDTTTDFYWEFANGKTSFFTFGPRGSLRDDHGFYFKTPEGWFWSDDTNRVNPRSLKIECSWFGLKFSKPDGYRDFWQRRFISGRRPDWMLRCLPWCIQ